MQILQKQIPITGSGVTWDFDIPLMNGQTLVFVLVEDKYQTTPTVPYNTSTALLVGYDTNNLGRLKSGVTPFYWGGNLPWATGMIFRVRIVKPILANTITITYGVGIVGEQIKLPNHDDKIPIYKYGKPTLISKAGAAGELSCSVRPGTDETWELQWMFGYHDDDAGPHTCNWNFYDGSTSLSLTPVSLAQNIHLPITWDVVLVSFPGLITIDYDTFLRFQADAMGATKKLYGVGLVLAYKKDKFG